jgi:RsiW-degrading membrane proteinase PrsW (M82 family)
MDRNEPEPIGLIIKIFILGMLSVIPAAFVEILIEFFLPIVKITALTQAFIQIAPVEEIVKLGIVLIFIWRDKNFNEENDGIVYAGTASLGFALAENILYVFTNYTNGLTVGIMRALTSIPLHTFCGIIMGYYLGIAKFAKDKTVTNGTIIKGLLIAIAIHGLYDTFALSGNFIALLLLPLIIIIFIFIIVYLNRGRILSLNRSNNPEINNSITNPTIDNHPETIPNLSQIKNDNAPKIWKIIISRILFTSCLIFWVLLIIGNNITESKKMTIIELIIGGLIFTLIPSIVGIFLEVSYYRRKIYNKF